MIKRGLPPSSIIVVFGSPKASASPGDRTWLLPSKYVVSKPALIELSESFHPDTSKRAVD